MRKAGKPVLTIEYALESTEPFPRNQKECRNRGWNAQAVLRGIRIGRSREPVRTRYRKGFYNMARAMEEILSDKMAEGIVITKYGYRETELKNIRIVEAGHPVPDDSGQEGANEIFLIAEDAWERLGDKPDIRRRIGSALCSGGTSLVGRDAESD